MEYKVILQEPVTTPELQALADQHQGLIDKVINDYRVWLDSQLEFYAREFSEPKIKGEITKGKVRWRGLRVCWCGETGETWLQQRGKDISPRFRHEMFKNCMNEPF